MTGFPDDVRSWDSLAESFAKTHSTLALCFPGYSTEQPVTIPRWGFAFDEVVAMLRATIVAHFGERKIVLVGHDWGSYVCFLYVNRYRDSIDKFVTLDVGLYAPKDMTLASNLLDVGYKGTLALAFVFRAIGVPVLGILAVALYPWKFLGPCPYETKVPPRVKDWFKKPDLGLCYPYFNLFAGVFTNTFPVPKLSNVPTLFLYGKNKRIMFHSSAFLMALDKADNSKHIAYDCGHFMQSQVPGPVADAVADFIKPS
ncbi:hypothetical protein CTAYLR_008120 [Chrysophaeum taylorii]|uniref:AB hydrolase-1 domain-containing protein n=1 Tax=Chrysophaeum taylorii TaxID=2483200 RepID=A0AAD7UK30_9STRA|nr:hypothetical protein CTAYLR_008120 [Chrysophaeum taylorii]